MWVGDISYVRTCSGFLYLAFVVDLFSRMVVGWSVQPHMRAELVDDYRETFANPFRAAELGYIDAIIHPRETRRRIITGLEMLKDKVDTNPAKKHGNIPL